MVKHFHEAEIRFFPSQFKTGNFNFDFNHELLELEQIKQEQMFLEQEQIICLQI